MKKRILGLALALVMILCLLPMTTFAAAPAEIKCRFWNTGSADKVEIYVGEGVTKYFVAQAVPNSTNQIIVEDAGTPTDNYLKLTYASGTLTMTFKNFSFTNNNLQAVAIHPSGGTFPIDVILEGTNTITVNEAAIKFENGSAATTITGSGSLTATSSVASDGTINKISAGSTMIIKDTTLNVVCTNKIAATAAIVNNGPLTIDNSNVTIRTYYARGIVTSAKYNTSPSVADYGITIKNGSNVLIDGLLDGNTVTRTCSQRLLDTLAIVIDNSTVELHRADSGTNPVVRVAPTFIGNFSQKQYKDNFNASYQDFPALEAGTTVPTSYNMRHFIAVHECVAAQPDGNCATADLCACGKVAVAAKPAHIAGANADDCTKDTICGNPGCTQVFEAATATAHTPKADDGDCTTDILCANTGCTQVVTKGAEKHKDTRTDCAVAGTCANTGCQHAFAAGQHNPAADDGDCTTAIKCATCGKEVKAGEAAHKYTDKNDTTCDNAGCTNTRKVDGTENPKTADNAVLVLALSLMAASAAAFVCTKKFAR